MNILHLVCYLGTAQGLFLSFTLLNFSKERKKANHFLAYFTAMFSFSMLNFALSDGSFYYDYPHLAYLTYPFVYLYGPILLLYIDQSISSRKLNRKDALHFIPALVNILYYSAFYLASSEQKRAYLSGKEAFASQTEDLISIFLFIGYMIVYAVIIQRRILRNKRKVRVSKYIHQVHNKWFTYILFAYIAYIILLICYYLLVYNQIILLGEFACFGLKYLMGISMFSIAFMAFKQPELFIENSNKKYKNSTFDPTEAQKILDKVLYLMEEEKLYTNDELSLQMLADHVPTTVHALSQILNDNLKQRFTDFVNAYRINDAKNLLLINSELNITEVFLKCGFKNKATFNRAFKKFVSDTPRDYRKRLAISSN